MSVIEQFIQEYEQVIAGRDAVAAELKLYKEAYVALAAQLGVDPARLMNMKVVQSELQHQAWSNKQLLVIALEEDIEKGV